jgi:hypothetical protein
MKDFKMEYENAVDPYSDYTKFDVQKRVLLEYLRVMIALEDWHGVADVAMDLRELEAKNK